MRSKTKNLKQKSEVYIYCECGCGGKFPAHVMVELVSGGGRSEFLYLGHAQDIYGKEQLIEKTERRTTGRRII